MADDRSGRFTDCDVAECSTPPSADEFFREYVVRNRPLILRKAARSWPAMRWSAKQLAADFPNEVVSVAPLEVSGPGAFRDKWLEPAADWEHDEPEPDVVDASQLLVVSAARKQMKLSRFIGLLRPASSPVAAAFYADGAGNLEKSFPFLRDSFSRPAFAERLQLKRADLWIGGHSVSRMHFDNLDNCFAQVVGMKTFVLAPPGAGAAYVSRRLRKATRRYAHPGVFTREGGAVLTETVINYLGVDRPPEMPTVSVTVGPGDILYLPFGWWHEVHGHPDEAHGGLCASISHFYDPYWCRLGSKTTATLGSMLVNPKYRGKDGDDGPADGAKTEEAAEKEGVEAEAEAAAAAAAAAAEASAAGAASAEAPAAEPSADVTTGEAHALP